MCTWVALREAGGRQLARRRGALHAVCAHAFGGGRYPIHRQSTTSQWHGRIRPPTHLARGGQVPAQKSVKSPHV